MTLHELHGPPPPWLADALAEFERQFTYPLGPGRSFRISHGEDYPRFFRAIGDAVCYVAERDGTVLGTICAAVQRLRMPDGGERPVIYLGDLKVAPAARGSLTLVRLVRAMLGWGRSRADAAYCVVMDGTSAVPTQYTGRLGIPAFHELGTIVVMRLPCHGRNGAGERLFVSAQRGLAAYREFTHDRINGRGGTPEERSETDPIWLMPPDATACGRLEDTRKAKRLVADDGTEMVSAHLACFGYRDVRAGAEFVMAACGLAAERGFPALFVAVPRSEAEAIRTALAAPDIVLAPATIYGAGLPPDLLWRINTSEI